MTEMTTPGATILEMRLIQAELRRLSARIDAFIDKLAAPAPPAAPLAPDPANSPSAQDDPWIQSLHALANDPQPSKPGTESDPWLQQLHDWISTLKPLDHEVDDSRESIYEEVMRDRA
jgi:hypothetical protein